MTERRSGPFRLNLTTAVKVCYSVAFASLVTVALWSVRRMWTLIDVSIMQPCTARAHARLYPHCRMQTYHSSQPFPLLIYSYAVPQRSGGWVVLAVDRGIERATTIRVWYLTKVITGVVVYKADAPWCCSFRLWRFINHLPTYLLKASGAWWLVLFYSAMSCDSLLRVSKCCTM